MIPKEGRREGVGWEEGEGEDGGNVKVCEGAGVPSQDTEALPCPVGSCSYFLVT